MASDSGAARRAAWEASCGTSGGVSESSGGVNASGEGGAAAGGASGVIVGPAGGAGATAGGSAVGGAGRPIKYLVVTGGVISGLGKGISISSLGLLLTRAGIHVTAIKIDPYLNVDAGTMSPLEHGEVFVLADGGEADLDLGNYERFLDVTLSRDHNITTGKVYSKVIEAERRGDYLGRTVQVIPHVTDAIQDWIQQVGARPVRNMPNGEPDKEPPQVCLVEVGGTVGDIESVVFLEALRQFETRVGRDNLVFVHVSLVPSTGGGEQKTKPTQHSVKELRSLGIQPDMIICRSTAAIDLSTREKLAMFCHVDKANMLSVHDVSNIYHVPLMLYEQGALHSLAKLLKLDINPETIDLKSWRALAHAVDENDREVRIALVGKYTGLQDSYLSVIKALTHSAVNVGRKLKMVWVDSLHLQEESKCDDGAAHEAAWFALKSADGILVPGGFGSRGIEGMIVAVQYARENGIPYLGVCLGLQLCVIEYARHVLGMTAAHSTEFAPETPHKAVISMEEFQSSKMGASMRLGAYKTKLLKTADAHPSIAARLYNNAECVLERHRHRYEVNPAIIAKLRQGGLEISGMDESMQRVEIVELPEAIHPFFFACQFHPEFVSKPLAPSPPFLGFVRAAADRREALGHAPSST